MKAVYRDQLSQLQMAPIPAACRTAQRLAPIRNQQPDVKTSPSTMDTPRGIGMDPRSVWRQRSVSHWRSRLKIDGKLGIPSITANIRASSPKVHGCNGV